MGGERARSFRDLPAGSSRVARGLVLLEIPEASVEELAAATGLSIAEVAASTEELSRTGWLVTSRTGCYAVADDARTVLQERVARRTAESDAREVRRRFAEYLLGAVRRAGEILDGTLEHRDDDRLASDVPQVVFADSDGVASWMADHLACVLAAVRMGVEHGLFALAARLAAAVWQLPPDVVDRRWWRDLAHWGEEAAIGWRNPTFLADLLDRSAGFFVRGEDVLTAEAQWVRALALRRRLNDQVRAVDILRSLGELYWMSGRLHRALDVLFDRLSSLQQLGDEPEVARVLGEIGSTMFAADRTDSAVDYLLRADRAFDALDRRAEHDHAEVLITLGRAQWAQGATMAARRCFSRSLAMLVDLDDAAADRVRQLLEVQDNDVLPGD